MIERICWILLLNLCFFFKTLKYKYTSDDIPVQQLHKDRKYRNWLEYRFLQVRGDIRTSPQKNHALTTILHSLLAMFIYLAFGATDISFIAALLFSFNPINNQGSVWISGRGYVLPPLFILITMTFPVLAPLTVGAAMYFNLGFVLVNMLPLWSMSFLPFIIIYAVFLRKKMHHDVKQKADFEMFDEDKKVHPRKLILTLKTLTFYTIHALIPIKTTFYHSFMQSLAGSGKEKGYSLDRYFWLGIPIVAGMVWKIFFTPWDLISFGLIWWVVGLLPFLNTFRLSQEIAERYAYAPLVGLMLALAHICVGNPALTAGILAMYATKLWFWMDSYQDDFFLVEASCLNSPQSWFAWHVKALKRWDVQSHKEAMLLWTMAKMISPKEFKILFNLATMLKIHNQHAEADAFIKEAERNVPKGQEKMSEKIIKDWHDGKAAILV